MCALKVDSKPPVSKGTLHCRLDGVRLVKSAVFDIKTGNLFVVYNGPEYNDPSSADHQQSHLGVWSVKDGVVSKSHTLVDIQDDLQPTTMVIVDLGIKQSLVLRTECEDDRGQLWETNFLSGGKDLVKPLSNTGYSCSSITGWKDLLFVSADKFGTLDVFKNLQHNSKMSIPIKPETLSFNYSFSDEYFVILLIIRGTQNGIYAHRWSPENLSIGDLILGPVEGCVYGSHVQMSPHYFVTNIAIGDNKDEEFVNRQRLAIYNIKAKSFSHFLLQGQDETERTVLIVEFSGKALAVLGRGSVSELS